MSLKQRESSLNDKNVPYRRCVGCNESLPKDRLIRIAASGDGRLEIDAENIMPGRGVYVCPDKECIKKAAKNNGFKRSLRRNIDSDILEKLFVELKEYER